MKFKKNVHLQQQLKLTSMVCDTKYSRISTCLTSAAQLPHVQWILFSILWNLIEMKCVYDLEKTIFYRLCYRVVPLSVMVESHQVLFVALVEIPHLSELQLCFSCWTHQTLLNCACEPRWWHLVREVRLPAVAANLPNDRDPCWPGPESSWDFFSKFVETKISVTLPCKDTLEA